MSHENQEQLIPTSKPTKVQRFRRESGVDHLAMAKEVMEAPNLSTETKLHLITLLTSRRKRG